MNYIYSLLTGIAMSVDCMCVSVSDGIIESNMKKPKMFFIAILFGFMQGAMPLIGFTIGSSVKGYIQKYIPYISFLILLILGLKSIIKAIIEDKKIDNKKEEVKEKHISIGEIMVQSVATSIDALTIGFAYLAYDDKMYIYLTFLIIAVITFLLSLFTVFLGRKIGDRLGKVAPFIAGIIFIALAIKFLLGAFL